MKNHGSRPSKKFAPSLSNDRTCEHEFTEEDVMTLEVDCSECSGAQSIENTKCASGIMNILSTGVVPEAVVLKRFIHVRYRSDRIARLLEAALAVAALKRLEALPGELSDKKCRTCPVSRPRLASLIIRRIRDDPLAFAASRAALSDKVCSEHMGVGCPQLRDCVARVLRAGHPNDERCD